MRCAPAVFLEAISLQHTLRNPRRHSTMRTFRITNEVVPGITRDQVPYALLGAAARPAKRWRKCSVLHWAFAPEVFALNLAVPARLKSWQLSRNPPFPRLAQIVVAICLLLPVNTSAGTRRAHTQAVINDNYVAALATADRFLQAWQTRDQETVVLLLTNEAKHRCAEERLEAFLSSSSKSAFEIGRGRKIAPGRYAFPVTIFADQTHHASGRPRYAQLIVAKTPNDDWAVDKLP